MIWNCIWSFINARSVVRPSDMRWFMSEELSASGLKGFCALNGKFW